MSEPTWVPEEVVLSVQRASLDHFGGLAGVRDPGLLDSALNRPRYLLAYGSNVTLFDLAAAYATGIVKNHPFLDGNKRCGFLVATTFLESNGFIFGASEEDATARTLALASGEFSEAAYAVWLTANCVAQDARSARVP
jgi:death-on-curing protein